MTAPINLPAENRYANVQELAIALNTTGRYIADLNLATTLYLALKLGKPVLLEGPAGVGKTEVAKALSRALDYELIRLQCYEGLDESRALYEWEYGKQLLFTQILRDKIAGLYADARSLQDAMDRVAGEESVFFSEKFLLARPLLQSLKNDKPTVLLIDEIDKADQEFEAFLLEILSDFQVTIPEIGTVEAKHRPIVILTSNQVRELGEALKRRCLYAYIDYPARERELSIVRKHLPEMDVSLSEAVVGLVHRIRSLELRKRPSVAETIEWAQALMLVGAKHLDKDVLRATLGTLAKHRSDAQKISDQADALLTSPAKS